MTVNESDKRVQQFLDLSFDFAVKLSEESERGSILISCSEVEKYLEKLVIAGFPYKSKSYVNRLIKYPGALSSFSSQIELAFAFRLIGENVYNALNALRSIRNKAAHSSDSFSLMPFKTQLEKIFEIREGYPEWINKIAYDNMMNFKFQGLKKDALAKGFDVKEIEKLWKDKIEQTDSKETFDRQHLSWKLFYGLSLLCMYLEGLEEQVKYSLKNNTTWLSVINGNI